MRFFFKVVNCFARHCILSGKDVCAISVQGHEFRVSVCDQQGVEQKLRTTLGHNIDVAVRDRMRSLTLKSMMDMIPYECPAKILLTLDVVTLELRLNSRLTRAMFHS